MMMMGDLSAYVINMIANITAITRSTKHVQRYLFVGSSSTLDEEGKGVSILSAAPESVLVVDCLQDSSIFSPVADSVVALSSSLLFSSLLLDLLIIVSTDLQNLAQALRTTAVSFNGFS